MPYLGLEKRSVMARMLKLKDLGILNHYTKKEGWTFSYFKLGNKFYELFANNEIENQLNNEIKNNCNKKAMTILKIISTIKRLMLIIIIIMLYKIMDIVSLKIIMLSINQVKKSMMMMRLSLKII